jgi:NitT/TauT family transport system permease protein
MIMTNNIQKSPTKDRGGKILAFLGKYGLSLSITAAILLLWEFVLPDSFNLVLPKPSVIIATIVEDRYFLWIHTQQTVLEAAVGFVLGTLLGIAIAVGFVYSRLFAQTIYPYSVVLQSTPRIALLPLFVALLGAGLASKVGLVTLATFFPTLVNMVQGLNSVDKRMVELMHTLNSTGRQLFWKVRLPFSMSYLFTALKITLTSAVLAALISEWQFADRGLGAMIMRSMFSGKGADLWSQMAVATVLSVLAYNLAIFIERRLVPWQAAVEVEQLEV